MESWVVTKMVPAWDSAAIPQQSYAMAVTEVLGVDLQCLAIQGL